jgi:integrase/recombinase XerD
MIDIAEDFLNRLEGKRAESTVNGHKSNLKSFSEFLNKNNIDPLEFDWIDFEDFLEGQVAEGYSNHTVRNRYVTVGMLYSRLQKKGIVEQNPADEVDIGDIADRTNKRKEQKGKERVWLTKDEITKLTNSAPQPVVRNRLIIRWMYYTACRRSEVANVKLDNLNFDKRKFTVYSPKKGETITVRRHPDLDVLLDEWLEVHRPSYTTQESEYLFITAKAEQIAPNHISRIVRKAAERAEIQETFYTDMQGNDRNRITSHSLRHSYAVHFLRPPNAGSFEELREILAHEDVTTTQIYGKILEDDIDEAYQQNTPSLNDDSSGRQLEQTCEKCGETKSKMVTHHMSYKPEEVMEICSDCHLEIHNGMGEYSHLMPDVSRKEAKEKGWI